MASFQRTQVSLLSLFFAELGLITFAQLNIKPYLFIIAPIMLVIISGLTWIYRKVLVQSVIQHIRVILLMMLGGVILLGGIFVGGYVPTNLSISEIKLYAIPVLLVLFPVLFGMIALKKGDTFWQVDNIVVPQMYLIQLGIFGMIIFAILFAYSPIAIGTSDTIPIMRFAVNQVYTGDFPYIAIEEDWGYDAFCRYLPMYWLPMIVPYCFNIDIRWIGVIIFIEVYFLYLFQYKKKVLELGQSVYEFPLVSLLPIFFVLFIPLYAPFILAQTMELMMVGYYMFLIYALFSEKLSLQIFAICLCILSRYSLMLWLPLWVGLMFFYDSKQKAMKLSLGIIGGFLLGYILPFGLQDKTIFAQSIAYYNKSNTWLWETVEAWQVAGDVPNALKGGGSLAIYFYHFVGGNIAYKLQAMQYTQLIVSGLFIVIAFFAYRFWEKKISYKRYAIYCFPIYLAIFYAFMPVPFMYLQLVPCGVMMALLMMRQSNG